jgi:hypothetical protein
MSEIITLNGDMEGYTIEKKDLLCKVATFIFVNTINNTNYGTWCTDFEQIESALCLPMGWVKENVEDIDDALTKYYGEMIADVEINDDEQFDVNLYHDFVDGYLEDDQALIENRMVEYCYDHSIDKE